MRLTTPNAGVTFREIHSVGLRAVIHWENLIDATTWPLLKCVKDIIDPA